jgi:phage tail sheath protein FI
MAETVFNSAGVTATEIDLSAPSVAGPVGTPAGVVGTANQGPAFVPVTIASYRNFAQLFGNTDGEKFGPLAVSQFLKTAQALTYIRVLGAGDCKKRSTSTGKVTSAGFVVGSQQVSERGVVARNSYATSPYSDLGRTYFLGCFLSDSAGSSLLRDAGIQGASILAGTGAHPIIRGVLMAPSGVILSLSGSGQASNTPGTGAVTASAGNGMIGPASFAYGGAMTGTMNLATQNFVILINGHKNSGDGPNIITASFDLESPAYFGNVLNTDPLEMEKKGHLLYARYDIHPAFCKATGSGIIHPGFQSYTSAGVQEDIAFILTSSLARDTGNTSVPDYESFEDRFRAPRSPAVISQDYAGTRHSLFRIFSISDGEFSNDLFKISIENIKPSLVDSYLYGTFDLVVRAFDDTDEEKIPLESYRGLSLDPSSDKFIARVIGDQNTYFDFDQATASQKLVVKGNHPVMSNYIRIEQSAGLKAGEVPQDSLPLGFRGLSHLVTSGSSILSTVGDATSNPRFQGQGAISYRRAVTPPVQFRESVAVGTSPNKKTNSAFYWGCQLSRKVSVSKPNLSAVQDNTWRSRVKYFPDFAVSNRKFSVGNNPGVADSGGTVLDCDRFNNNLFSLERIKVRTGSDTIADVNEWVSASYVRKGSITANESNKTRALKVSDLKTQGNRRFGKFTFVLQGGFDGTDMFNRDRVALANAAVKREMDDESNQGGTNGPTVAAYRKAVDMMATKADVDINLLVIPGIRHSSVTTYAIDAIEDRFDALYIMDIEERDEINTVVTSSVSNPSVAYTVAAFKNRGLNSSFAAAYFPDVIMTDPTTKTNVQAPPSVAVLGAFAINDSIGYPWFAPAGFTRGALKDSLYAKVPVSKANMDTLYDADINPITAFPGTGLMVFGQKTLLATDSSLDRVNVRRLLINVRRSVRAVANTMLFEPNRQETLDRFNALVTPILQSVQERSGVDRYKVVIDATTTTQADIENNTLRGKIFLQPTRTAEFIALDFVVTNAGDAFQNA